MGKYVVIARKWFDKINGNTYHNVRLYNFKGEYLGESGMEYGYDDAWKQTALEVFKNAGIKLERLGFEPNMSFLDVNRAKHVFCYAHDVSKRKEL